ncbi:MAG: response regulator transcription factor [Flavobacteriales bacterium]|nr:response regulator transcription factor [Flavobacteriia bacterium]NCP06985.1 response regulator transcription factor [Flavobacteriales bacterium]PIV94584.1 MAG: DNA-binding response regulator [Flavobacteriaceae bacterium CG17_big_fil_post_rev_8_21_14_2_50_33_15]PIY13428.1 MAG: DNA-binding response regulator [Flavobacteriaceae bacterium CG_4_10_14_3_um_filter_33_47]PJB18733.1 MAG: DNA-binding response regulator [Flavobacteriaceae bacterium CG_4_9_14_3_um_filter_33_16]
MVGTFNTVEEGIIGTKTLEPKLVFLDVKIKNKTGFDYLKQVGDINFNIVFTTGFEIYAVEAFKFSALDYLLKPIDKEDFHASVLKLKNVDENSTLKNKIDVLFHNLKVNNTFQRISIATIDGYLFIEVSDILYCKADINYTHIYTKQGDKITTSKTLKTFEKLLLNNHFFRVHNSRLVNLFYVKKYTKGKGCYLTMNDNTKIDVSIRRKDEFIKKFIDLS